MSKFVILKRLGISRGWRIQLPNKASLYAVSLLHCIFIYSFLKSKALKLGFWILSYFIVCFWKKYLIHIFYWKIPGTKKNITFKNAFTVKFKYKRGFVRKRRTRLGLFFGPTKFLRSNLSKIKKKFFRKRRKKVKLGGAFKSKFKSKRLTVWGRGSRFFNFMFGRNFLLPPSQFARGFIKDNSGVILNTKGVGLLTSPLKRVGKNIG